MRAVSKINLYDGDGLTKGKTYDVLYIVDELFLSVDDDSGEDYLHNINYFEFEYDDSHDTEHTRFHVRCKRTITDIEEGRIYSVTAIKHGYYMLAESRREACHLYSPELFERMEE